MKLSLWSFEGARLVHPGDRLKSVTGLKSFGGDSGGGTPLPIPNRAVKPASADGTRRATSRESRSPPNYFQGPRKRPFSLGDCAQFLPPVGIEPSQPAHALADRGMRDEECSETLLGDGIEDVEGLGRRIRAELDQLRSLLE